MQNDLSQGRGTSTTGNASTPTTNIRTETRDQGAKNVSAQATPTKNGPPIKSMAEGGQGGVLYKMITRSRVQILNLIFKHRRQMLKTRDPNN